MKKTDVRDNTLKSINLIVLDLPREVINQWEKGHTLPWYAEIAIKATEAGLMDLGKDYFLTIERREEIAKIRQDLNLTQAYVAALVGKSQQSINAWEKNKLPPLWMLAVMRALKAGEVEIPRNGYSLRSLKESYRVKFFAHGHRHTWWQADGEGGVQSMCTRSLGEMDPRIYCGFTVNLSIDKMATFKQEVHGQFEPLPGWVKCHAK